jgi:alpha-tubulin suppressor-like RCC1 family protein
MTSKTFFNDSKLIKKMIKNIKQSYDIKQLVAGGIHTLALTQEGHVWALGLEHNENLNKPERIKNLNNVTQLVERIDHSLTLTQEGRVFAWGNNEYGQLGLGNNNNQNTPTRINFMPSSIQALLQRWEDRCENTLTQTGGKADYRANGNDNGDAK